MSDEQKQEIIEKVLSEFNFEKVHCMMYLMGWNWHHYGNVPTKAALKKTARKLLTMVLEHTDRQCWWASRGGLCAFWDDVNGVGLCFIPVYTRLRKSEL
jgi:hypothetical protein